MKKILLFALVGATYLAIVAANEANNEDSVARPEDSSVLRVERSAEALPDKKDRRMRRKKERSSKKKKQQGGNKKKRVGKKKSKRGRKVSRRSKAKKGKRKGKKRRKMKKAKKDKKKDKKKMKKQSRRRKNKQKKRTGKLKKAIGTRQTCSDAECLNLAFVYLRNAQNKVINYQKQKLRIERFQRVSRNKGAKNGSFIAMGTKLKEAGGGNASNLLCQGKGDGEGAKKLKEVVGVYDECKKMITANCSGEPAYNASEVNACLASVEKYDAEVSKCIEAKGAAACTCWKSATLKTLLTDINKCDLSTKSQEFAKFKKGCIDAHVKCRGQNSDAMDIIFTCSSSNSPEKLLVEAKNAKAVKDSLTALKAAIQKILSSLRKRDRTGRALPCADYSKKVNSILAMAKVAPISKNLAEESKALASDPPTDCKASDKTSLTAAVEAIDEGIEKAQEAFEALTETLQGLTGSTPSSSDIDSATEPSTATRRYRRARSIDRLFL